MGNPTHRWRKGENHNHATCMYCRVERYRKPYHNSTVARYEYFNQAGGSLGENVVPECKVRIECVGV